MRHLRACYFDDPHNKQKRGAKQNQQQHHRSTRKQRHRIDVGSGETTVLGLGPVRGHCAGVGPDVLTYVTRAARLRRLRSRRGNPVHVYHPPTEYPLAGAGRGAFRCVGKSNLNGLLQIRARRHTAIGAAAQPARASQELGKGFGINFALDSEAMVPRGGICAFNDFNQL